MYNVTYIDFDYFALKIKSCINKHINQHINTYKHEDKQFQTSIKSFSRQVSK